jgi:murein L,D-transpeptidase YafK
MTQRPLSLLIVLGAAALALAGCKTETASRSSTKDIQPIPAKTMALMAEKGMRKEDPILVRVYKEDSKLEVWKKRQQDGRYAMLKSYEICRWSGNLGPKKAEGDHQAPEGFYTITPGQMNPKSAYYLSFDTGFPNAYDKSLGRSGKNLMVHGDCLSAGCYAMTDPQIAEVYAIAREAFRGGQKSFQFQAMPFRMTAENMARRRNDPNLAFWKNLKEGADHFEVTKLEPKVNVCGKKYVFDANSKDGGSFDPNAQCPTYEVEPSVAMAVAPKIKQDEQRFAQLVASGMQVAEAYVPQNGRVRRNLGDPISSGVMMASAAPAATPMMTRAPQEPAVSLAMADVKAPQPAPSPYAAATPAAPAAPSSGLLAWARPAKPAELETARTPSAPVAAETPEAKQRNAVAAAERQVALQPPMTASLGPSSSSNYKPFYKRMLGFGGGEATGPVVVAAPPAPILPPEPEIAVALPAARPAAVAKPVARPAVTGTPAPKVAAVPAPKPQATPAAAPKAPAQTASAAPQLPQSDFGLMSGAPILGAGTFTR